SQPRHIPARHQALALVDATAIVTTKTPIRLIQNNFVSPNPEVGLGVAQALEKARFGQGKARESKGFFVVFHGFS
ncbi:MAG TPA: hypothetical protein VKA12_01595, partial [Roseiarcus sp.]|nr:hypothetical protein [Roseiarcus sp.]